MGQGRPLPATPFKSQAIALSGVVDYEMYTKFRAQFDNASNKSIVVIGPSTLGGDPEVMMGEDVGFASETEPAKRFVFLAKAAIYSAGVTFMSFFARENRYLTRGTRLMIHERKLSKKLVIDGPPTTRVAVVRTTLNEARAPSQFRMRAFKLWGLDPPSHSTKCLKEFHQTGISELKRQSTSDLLKRCCEGTHWSNLRSTLPGSPRYPLC